MAAKPRVKAGTSKSAAAERRRAFALAYIENGRNGKQAAITAGYAPHSAEVTASQLLRDPKVRALVDELTEKHAAAAGLSVERTLREVARLAYVDPRKFYRDDGTMVPVRELDDDTAAALASIETDEIKVDGVPIGQATKVKFWDKNASLEKAMKHLGLYKEDNAQQQENLVLKIVAATPRKS